MTGCKEQGLEKPRANTRVYSAMAALLVELLFWVYATSAAPLLARPTLGGKESREDKITVAPGVRLRVVETGEARGSPPIVLIPGWSAGADIWRGQIERFKGAHRVISYDPRSQGQSTKTMSGNTPEQRADDLHELLRKKGAHGAVLVGWSQAVQDIAAYAKRHGTADIGGIVLVDAAVSDGANAIQSRPADVAFQFKLFGIYLSSQEEYLRGMFRAIVTKPQAPGLIEQAVATAMQTPPSIGMSMLVSDMFTLDRRPALSQIDCPVLIIAAANSRERERQKDQVGALKRATFVEIDDAGHAVFLDQPAKFASALGKFLKSLSLRSTP